MPEFTVAWSIQIDAEDDIDAVKQVIGMMQDPWNTATYFRVDNHETGETTIKDYEKVWSELVNEGMV